MNNRNFYGTEVYKMRDKKMTEAVQKLINELLRITREDWRIK